jgi:hypothetical protein
MAVKVKLFSITEIARRLGVERRALKRRTRVQPVAVAALGGFNVDLYRLEDFTGQPGADRDLRRDTP